MSKKNCVSIENLVFGWRPERPILSVASFHVEAGETVFLHGASGSGKSTLLGLIAGVSKAQRGVVDVLGHPLSRLSAAKRDRLRSDAFGVIFQQFNLVPYLSLIENVLLPCQFSPTRAARTGASPADRNAAAVELLSRLGLAKQAQESASVAALSVGQQQRVAAARAIIGAPSLIIADEPTSALDATARDTFIETLLGEAKQASVIFVSHDISLAAHFDRTVSMSQLNQAMASELKET